MLENSIRAEYQVPFNVNEHPVKIMQGWNGPWSHKLIYLDNGGVMDLRYAVDFILPINTPILAARDGFVLGGFYQSTSHYSGEDPNVGNSLPTGFTNYLIIEHADETVATYSHLRHLGIVPRVGEIVKAGQLIAYTGLSGWVGDTPHLHFQINKDADSIPFRFINYSGPLEHSEIYPNQS
jgi:murein DD-endopeptidase MepM/ murein hydrolase activator NlpD